MTQEQMDMVWQGLAFALAPDKSKLRRDMKLAEEMLKYPSPQEEDYLKLRAQIRAVLGN